ncbi:MAG: hypothetical protein COB98_01745 [Flavobacteriaceae bacterium]|nr:MAG: hypothetical protein COB98_01745 [Flavobacteriaceae bacterium]
MMIQIQDTVAETLTQNIGADNVFGKYNIDFCCGGGMTLEQACKESGVAFETLKQEIEAITNTISRDVKYDDFNIEDSIDYVSTNFHQYFSENVPLIGQYAAKVAQVHGEDHGEVVEVNAVFMQLATLLSNCLTLDEVQLFPKMTSYSDNSNTVNVASEISILTLKLASNYKTIGAFLKELSGLTNKFTAPEGACNTYQTLYVKLADLEQKLHNYMHFQMNVLFSKI